MTRIAAHLNAFGSSARDDLLRCCHSERWADAMIADIPFENDDAVRRAAWRHWVTLHEEDWLEAFSRHPRIGERASGWAAGEQRSMAAVSPDLLDEFVRENERYEERFGFVFLICATGKSPDEMLGSLRERIDNDRQTELLIAAEQQALITSLRLSKLVAP